MPLRQFISPWKNFGTAGMDVEEIAGLFRGAEKGPERPFTRTACNGFTLYTLPNGIGIFDIQPGADLRDGEVFPEGHPGLGIGFPFSIVEIADGHVVIKRRGIDTVGMPPTGPSSNK